MNIFDEVGHEYEFGRIDALIDGKDPEAADHTEDNTATRSSPFTAWLKKTCLDAFVATYGFDGYNFATKKATYARTFSFDSTFNQILDNATGEQHVDSIDTPVLVASFFGAPSRPEAIKDIEGNITAVMFSDRATLNLLGGLDAIRHRAAPDAHDHPAMDWTEKDRWEVLLSPIKLTLLFPLKAALLLPKLMFNIVKLFTEFLPAVLSTALSTAENKLYQLFTHIMNNEDTYKKVFTVRGTSFTWTPIRGLARLGLVFLWSPLYLISVASDVLKLLGRAFTSPEKSARLAFADVSHALLNNDWFSQIPFAGLIAKIAGGLTAALSIAISATLWAVALTVTFGAIASAFPAVLEIGSVLAMKFPVIAAAIQSALSFVGTLTATVFGPAIGTMTSFFGISVSVATLSSALTSAGLIVGMLVIPVGSALTACADALSNWWARWDSKTGPLTSICRAFKTCFCLSRNPTQSQEESHLHGNGSTPSADGVSPRSQTLVQGGLDVYSTASASSRNTDLSEHKAYERESAQRFKELHDTLNHSTATTATATGPKLKLD